MEHGLKKMKFFTGKRSLFLCFIGTYIWTLISLMPWGTELIIVSSFFLFIPLIPYLVPFFSLAMLTNSELMVKLGYFTSLTSFIYLLNAIKEYPIKLYMGGEMSTFDYYSLILSLISYMIVSTFYFVYKLKELDNK